MSQKFLPINQGCTISTISYVQNGCIPISVIFFEFWEDDEETRIVGRAGMVHLPNEGDESEDGDRVSFPRWGKRNVVSHHFAELKKSRKQGSLSKKEGDYRVGFLI